MPQDFLKFTFANLMKHLENEAWNQDWYNDKIEFENPGLRMKCILGLNYHWYDALLNYSPTQLTIDGLPRLGCPHGAL